MRKLFSIQAGIVAFAFSAFVTLIVPVQTYLGNRDLFEFSLGSVIGAALPLAGLSFVAMFAALLVLGMFCGRVGYVVLTALRGAVSLPNLARSGGREAGHSPIMSGFTMTRGVISCENRGVFQAN